MPCSAKNSLTGKDLTILEDQLTQLSNVSRVMSAYANDFQTPAFQQTAMAIAKHHCDQFQNLLQVLDGCNCH